MAPYKKQPNVFIAKATGQSRKTKLAIVIFKCPNKRCKKCFKTEKGLAAHFGRSPSCANVFAKQIKNEASMLLAEQHSAPTLAEENLDATELSTTSIDTDSSGDAESLDSSASGTYSSNKHSLDDSLDGADNHTDDDTIQHEPSQMECFSNGLYFQT